MTRLAVILFTMGGPDSPDAVEPFLFNLFNDPAIIGLPGPLRWLVAKMISRRRAPVAREIYAHIGGRSPLLELTRRQGLALERELAADFEVKSFVAMRYWHPFSGQTVAEVLDFAPDQVVLLPMYPQFSTTTSASSINDWKRSAVKAGLTVPSRDICCHPLEPGFIRAVSDLIAGELGKVDSSLPPRVLFSAHGLPKKVIAKGDPYQWQVEKSAAAVVDALAIPDLDWQVCYQSRVGPLEWIGPSTDDEIRRAGAEGRPVVLVPIAFVSEHSETLVELDIEYRELAEASNVPAYHRVSTVIDHPEYIRGLGRLVRQSLDRIGNAAGDGNCRCCPEGWSRCPAGGM